MRVQVAAGQWLLSLLFLIGAAGAQAKELTSRLGVGFSEQTGVGLPSLAIRYYPSASLGLSTSLGVDTQKNNSRFGLMASVYRVIFMEDNLNFYLGAGGGVLSEETKGQNKSGFELSGFFGFEFFLYGLDSLSFIVESGVMISSISSEVRFRTLGKHPMRAGVFFYF